MDESESQRSFIRIKQELENMLVIANFFLISWEDLGRVLMNKFGILVSLNGQVRIQQIIFHSSTISYGEFQNNVREILNSSCF